MAGTIVSHYKIIREIGSGGMGVVYEAKDLKLGRAVALKFLRTDSKFNPVALQRFRQEAQAASALDHPNVCTIYEIDETEDGAPFIVMALYEGESLQGCIARKRFLEVDEALDILLQITKGLAQAHERNIFHRDLKPANIFITKDGAVKILDFGLAKLAGTQKLTRSGAVLGTTPYMAPEQIQNDIVDRRADIWSLGVLLFEMLTGELPFEGEYDQSLMYAIVNKEAKSVKALRSEVEDKLAELLERALMKDPAMRYQHVVELQEELASCTSLSQSTVGVATRAEKKKSVSASSTFSLQLALLIISLVLTAIVISLFPLKIWRTNTLHRERVLTIGGIAVLLPEDHSHIIDPVGRINYDELLKCKSSDPERLNSLRPYLTEMAANHFWQLDTWVDRMVYGFFDRIDDQSFWNTLGCMLNAWLLVLCVTRLERSSKSCYRAAAAVPKSFYGLWLALLAAWIGATVFDHSTKTHGAHYGGFWTSDFIPEVRMTQIIDMSLFFAGAVAAAYLFLLKIHLVRTMAAAKFRHFFAGKEYLQAWEFLLNSSYFAFMLVSTMVIAIQYLFEGLIYPLEKGRYMMVVIVYHLPFLAVTAMAWSMTRHEIDYKIAGFPLTIFWISANKKAG